MEGFGGLLALGGVALGAVMTLRQVRANREGHTIDLFTKAIDQLASDQVSVRHGGVYALEQLSELDPRYRGHAHALLTAFVRRHAPWPPTKPESEVATNRRPLHGGVADDIGAALAVLSRRAMIVDGAWSELERVDLRDAELDGLDIPHVCFAHSNLEGAPLVGAKLAGATLSDSVLRKADLSGADLCGADLTRVTFAGQYFSARTAPMQSSATPTSSACSLTTQPHGHMDSRHLYQAPETRGRRDPGQAHFGIIIPSARDRAQDPLSAARALVAA